MNPAFSFSRFMKLVRWTIATDRPFNRRWGSIYLGIIATMLMILNLSYLFGNKPDEENYGPLPLCFIVCGLVYSGGYLMFSSFSDNRDALRSLHLLPASNAEKFAVRYLVPTLTHLLMLVGAILIADLLQYVVGLLIGREPLSFITMYSLEIAGRVVSSSGIGFIILLGVWTHTFYLLGCNFFRSIKYSWGFTTIVLVLLFIACITLPPLLSGDMYQSGFNLGLFIKHHIWPIAIVLIVLSVVQVWLAYRLFSRRQLIGRFFNGL